jgi:ribonuclease Y
MENPVILALYSLVVALAAGAAGYWAKAMMTKSVIGSLDQAKKTAEKDADTILKDARVRAKEEVLKAREEFETSTQERKAELKKQEDRLNTREENIERKADLMEKRGADIDRREEAVQQKQQETEKERQRLDELISRQITDLEKIAGLDREAAKQQLLERLEHQLESEKSALIRRVQEESQERLENEAREIMVNAMERYANDCAYERTTSTIPLPNEEMKGRIIGRDGRNIRTLEAEAGVSVLIDDTPEAVVISCFDPVRRHVAKLTMERLVGDGRIHPARIEDVLKKVTKEVDDEILKTGREAVEQVGVPGVKQPLVKLLGRLRYRYSYSQNVLQHSIETAYFMGIIAAQLGLDEQKAKRAGLLHDIGKAVDHEVEGTHALIGADILKRHGEDAEVITAVGAHHEEMDRTSPMAILCSVCDALSASRPGARCETTELYLKRLEEMEAIGNAFNGVDSCFAISAGRELRVIVQSDTVSEEQSTSLARDIANQIESQMRYPGQVRVSVIRETRAVDYAR